MAEITGTFEAEVLQAVVRRLQTNLLLTESACFLTEEPLSGSGAPTGAEYWLTVSPGDSTFDRAFQYGGGVNQVFEDATCIVTGYTRIRLDPTARDTKRLIDLQRGLLPIKARILAAMLKDDTPLTDSQGNPIPMRSLVTAVGAQRPAHDQDKNVGWVSVIFSIPFDWNLQDLLP